MKNILFNIYKIWYIHNNKQFPYHQPNFFSRFAASSFVFIFLAIACINIFLPFMLIFDLRIGISKPMTWLYMLAGSTLVYLLLFKLLGLEDHNYGEEEHRLSHETIRKSWKIFFINVAILVLVIAIKLIVRRG
jgi:hypothetical protein